MTKTFKIGDIVEANEASDHEYGLTTKANGWRGKVTRVHTSWFAAETVAGKGSEIGGRYGMLLPKYFDLVTSNATKQSIEIIEGLTVELTAEQLEEVSRKLQSAKDKAREELSKPEFKIGDIVVITDNTNHSANKVGDIGIIEEIPKKNNPIVAVPGRKSGKGWSHTKPEEMRLATAEEIAKYEEALKPKVKVGDWIRNIKDEDSDLTIGKVYKVNDIEPDGFVGVTDDLGDENGIASEDYEIIDKLTPFDRAGRKPGEFKVGDIVRVVDANGGNNMVGDLVEVYLTDGTDTPKVVDRDGDAVWEKAELVTPVESRVDNAEGGERA